MNCQQALLLIGADPDSTSSELADHLRNCPACSEFQTEMLALEAQVRRALEQAPAEVPAPAMPRNRAEPRVWRGWALAASLLIAVVTTLAVWFARPADSLAHDLAVHVTGEPRSWDATRPVDAHSLEEILRNAGVGSSVTSNEVVYARTCWFRGHYVPHLVVQTTGGPVTVMVLPDEHVRARVSFYESGFAGVIVPARRGSIAVLARGTANIDDVATRLRFTPEPGS